MRTLPYILFLAGIAISGVYLFRPFVRRRLSRYRYAHRSPELPAHERWPEILHWREGDEFRTTGWSYWSIHFRAFADDRSSAYCNVNYGHSAKLAISELVGTNISLRDRNLNEQICSSHEYGDLIKQFREAYAELEARDRRNGIDKVA